MSTVAADNIRALVNYARVNEIQAYLHNERKLLQLAQLLENRKLSGVKARDLQQLMGELGYGIPHYLETLHNWSARYEAGGRPWDAVRQEEQPHPLVRRFSEAGFASRGRLLEIGCGHGANARYLSTRGAQVLAIDVARPAIQSATAHAGTNAGSCRFLCTNVFDLEIEPDSFDAVLDCWCFHHIPVHLTPAFAERVARALRPGGQFLLLCHSPHSSSALALTYGLAGALPKAIAYLVDATTESVLSREEIRDIFSPYFELGPIELHHDVHVRSRGHYSFVVLMKKRLAHHGPQ
jgi:2-polyprenyl-3-methyl-5-hydroxy-6-metoxy-1,4-benzoquinol methylase